MLFAPIFIKYLDPPLRKNRFSRQLYTRLHGFKNWNFRKFPGSSPSPSLDPSLCSISGFALELGFALILGRSRHRFRLCPQYSSGASCLGSGIDLDSPMFISSSHGRSPTDPYPVSVFKKLKFSHFNHLILILTRM